MPTPDHEKREENESEKGEEEHESEHFLAVREAEGKRSYETAHRELYVALACRERARDEKHHAYENQCDARGDQRFFHNS